jgi:PLP dependent protein
MGEIATNIQKLLGRIEHAAERAGRHPADVRLIGATKSVAPERVIEALDAGLRDFGENFVQEADERRRELKSRGSEATWHFIGHLQTNKTSVALSLFDILQSVDSLRLAQHLSRRATKPVRILLEVNVAREASKFGFAPAEVAGVVSELVRLPNLQMEGLMTIAPESKDPESVRPVFRELRQLAEAHGLEQLSMGMTDDFEVAVEEGATMVRVGRAIFGERK